MKTLIVTILIFCQSINMVNAQNSDPDESLPYYEIPEYPENYTAGTVASRMIDALGFRFYWATEGLREDDLKYRPNEEARNIEETVTHIYEMSTLIANTILHTAVKADSELSYEEKRKAVLLNLKAASDSVRNSTAEEVEGHEIKFGNGATYPFWNLLNGPIADALWHCGQIVSLRRSSGNPFNSNVSVFSGKLRQ